MQPLAFHQPTCESPENIGYETDDEDSDEDGNSNSMREFDIDDNEIDNERMVGIAVIFVEACEKKENLALELRPIITDQLEQRKEMFLRQSQNMMHIQSLEKKMNNLMTQGDLDYRNENMEDIKKQCEELLQTETEFLEQQKAELQQHQ